jgi:hypothetical protein
MSEDPIGFDAGDGNLYRYVINTPVNSIDPLGTLRMLPRTAPLPVLRPTPVGPKPFIPPWLWPWFSPISPFWATPLDTREEDVVKANKKCRRGELDPPWPERDKWPRNCQFDYKIPGEMINIQFDICVYACRQAGRSFQIQRTIEKGTMCPKWFEWVPTTRTPNTPDIDPNNLPPDAIP